MKKIFTHSKLYNVLFLSASTLFVITLSGRTIARANSSAINSALGITTTNKGNDADAQYFKRTFTDAKDVKDYVSKTAEEVEGEGLVLLKNANKALPLTKGSKVSLLGTASVHFNYNTSGSSSTDSSKYVTLQDALTKEGFSINPALTDFYTNGAGKDYGRVTSASLYTINEVPYEKYDASTLSSIEQYSDAAIVTFSRESGEGKDLSTSGSDGEDGSYLSLSKDELDLLKGLTERKKQGKLKKIVVLLNAANPIEQDYLFREGIDVDALLWVGNVGSYGLNGVAKVLNGTINPSGRLSDTYCRDNFSSPARASWELNFNKSFAAGYTNWKKAKLNSTNRSYGVYNEGVYLGYRYYETRYEDAVLKQGNNGEYDYSADVAFPFGYGLSYTSFAYSNFKVVPSSDEKTYQVSIDVTNTGETKGKHAVEIYRQRPYTGYDKEHGIEKPSIELAAFAKTKELEPGEKETVKLSVEKSQFKTYDADGYKTYILEAGDYYLSLGSDAHDALNNIIRNKSSMDTSKRVGSGNASHTYKISFSKTDTETYSKSEETGEPIINQLDHADRNRYEGRGDNKVTYVSRNDWTGTWPKQAISFTATDQRIQDLSSHHALPDDGTRPSYNKTSEEEKKLMVASLRGVEFDSPYWDTLLDSRSKEAQIKLVTSGQRSTATIASVGLPETVDLDGPTAVTATKTDSSFPSEGIWASSFNLDLIKKVGDAFAEDIILSDTHGIYAPGVNLHRTPFIGRSNEYFSEDSLLTGLAAAYEIQGLQGKGVITHLKHFAFNECETERNGIGIWLNEQEARELLLTPFEIAVTKGDTGAIMSSFNRSGCLWTGGDKNLSINILQKEWGFKGYAITDRAVSNGGTYRVYDDGYRGGTNLFMGSANDLKDYKNNAAFCQMVRDSAKRILYTIANKSWARNGIKGDSVIKEVVPWWEITLNTCVIVFGVLAAAALARTITSIVLTKKQK